MHIKHHKTCETIYESDASTISLAVLDAIEKHVQLTGADLKGARLSGANLTGASLAGTDLTGADLSGATR